jgi:hypothetical protein
LGNYSFCHEHGAGDIDLNDPVFLTRLKDAGIDHHKDLELAGAKWMMSSVECELCCETTAVSMIAL